MAVSPQALDERFGERAAAFLEICLQKSLAAAASADRIRKADTEANKKHKFGRISEKYRRFLHYSMFLTNLPDDYRMEELYVLYLKNIFLPTGNTAQAVALA